MNLNEKIQKEFGNIVFAKVSYLKLIQNILKILLFKLLNNYS